MPPDSPNPVERFEPVVKPVRWPLSKEVSQEPDMRPAESGEWVKLEDYQAEVEKREEVEGELRTLLNELERLVPGWSIDSGLTPIAAVSQLRVDKEAAESKLSSAVKKLEELAEEAERRASSITGVRDSQTRAVEEGALAAFDEAIDLLRDKGTEQGGAVSQFCGTEHHVLCPGCPCACHGDNQGGDASAVGPADVGRTSTDVAGAGVSMEGDPGLVERERDEALAALREINEHDVPPEIESILLVALVGDSTTGKED